MIVIAQMKNIFLIFVDLVNLIKSNNYYQPYSHNKIQNFNGNGYPIQEIILYVFYSSYQNQKYYLDMLAGNNFPSIFDFIIN